MACELYLNNLKIYIPHFSFLFYGSKLNILE